MKIGDKIRNERLYKKLSQKQLADRVRMSEPAIRNYELGNRTPSPSQIELIAGALGVSPLALSNPDLETHYGIMYTFFYLENIIDLHPVKVDGQVYLSASPIGKKSRSTNDMLNDWLIVYNQFINEEMTAEEYKEWKDTYPAKVVINRK